jgi:hypothetical protein
MLGSRNRVNLRADEVFSEHTSEKLKLIRSLSIVAN